MGDAARAAGVAVVTGDTKVVERGKADRLFVNTAGIGVVPAGVEISGDRARPGDAILISGTMGDHGVAIMAHRAGLEFETTIVSDSASLNGLVADMVAAVPTIRVLRDPTRGGLAATLNEICHQSGVGMRLDEAAIPIKPEVLGACELLGLDALNVANEGKLIAIVPAADAARLLDGPARASARPRCDDDRRSHRRPGPLRAHGDAHRRRAHRRLACGRAAAAHLLRA